MGNRYEEWIHGIVSVAFHTRRDFSICEPSEANMQAVICGSVERAGDALTVTADFVVCQRVSVVPVISGKKIAESRFGAPNKHFGMAGNLKERVNPLNHFKTVIRSRFARVASG